MSGLQITVTSAGRAAQVNAENTGTAPVTITQIGITDQAVVTDDEMTALPGEIKRLSTFAGAAVAADTIHVTIRDDSADVYSLRGFGLYLGDGTLYAVYGQADVVLEKSAQAMMLLAADIIFANIDATSLTFGDTNWINPPATTTVQGVIELATNAEALTGTDTQRGIVAAALKYVLDSRFGAGAPSAFAKGLLALTTAAAFRLSLELRSAALNDAGAGNGLDADLLDGQHGAYYQAWANLSGKPATFAPSAHGHSWGELSAVPATASRWPIWDEVTGKPLTFTPSGHSHDATHVVSGVFAAARIPELPMSSITGLPAALDTKVTATPATNDAIALPSGYQNSAVTTGNMPNGGPIANAVHITARSLSDNRVAQLVMSATGGTSLPDAWLRTYHTSSGGGGWTVFAKIWTDLNFDPASKAPIASPALTGTPTAPTAVGGTNTMQLATTAFVQSTVSSRAPLASPALTGTPTGPTAAVGANTTQLATTAFVQAAISAALANYLPKANPVFTGTMTGPGYDKS